MNDPNGLVYSGGVYHAFYQYNPRGDDWGNIAWGHATSRDLVHWAEQPVAMNATHTEQIFSGSVVVDTKNTSGLGTRQDPAMIALYTSAHEGGPSRAGVQAQSMAYSLDDGTTWKQYDDNPVLTLKPESANFRDPKVTWYEPGGYWIMTTVVADAHVVKIYRSDDLRSWEFLSNFSGAGPQDGLWEMPELVEMPVEGQPGRRAWVLLLSVNPGGIAGGSGMTYFVGDFDGTRFEQRGTPPQDADGPVQPWLDHGADYYAATSISGAPGGRPVLIAWMSNWDYAADVPTTPWRGSMAIPRELTLTAVDDALVVTSAIADRASRVLRSAPAVQVELSPRSERLAVPEARSGSAQLIDVVLTPQGATTAGLIVRASANGEQGTTISYDAGSGLLALDRTRSGKTGFSPKFSLRHEVKVLIHHGEVRLTVLVDNGSVEVFAQDGKAVLTDTIFPAAGNDRVFVFARGGDAEISLQIRNQ
jgi:levanbiose-producing levanase